MTLSPLLQSLINVALGVLILFPLFLYPFLYFFQEKLLFHPRPIHPTTKQTLLERFPQGEVRLSTSDRRQLHGWLVHGATSTPGKKPLLLYFGGNAEEISEFILAEASMFPTWSVLSLNYRGYGESQGKPGEKGLFGDARHIYDWATQQPDIDPEQVVVMGRSLGTGVAVYLASKRPVSGVVLISPYDSIRGIAQGLYPYAPVTWLLKHPFDSLARAPMIRAPMLMLVAEKDTIIPPPHSRRLAQAWGGPHTEKVISGEGHNSITFGTAYHETIWAFLEQITTPPAHTTP